MSFNYDPRNALLLTDIDFEAETFASDAVTGDPPIEPPEKPIIDPPTLCGDPDALNFGEPGDCIYRTLADLVMVMTTTQLAVSQDFYTSASPAWTNCKTGALAGPSVGAFTNAALSATGDAWVITAAGDRDANGLWHCANIFAATPSFTLILSHNAWATLAGFAPPQDIISLGCDDGGVAYITGTGGAGAGNTYYAYGTAAMTLVTTLPQVSGKEQHSIGSGASVRLAIGAGGVPVIGIEELISGAHSTKLWWLGAQPNPSGVAVGFFRSNVVVDLYSYVDGGAIGVLVYSGAALTGQVITDGTNVLTVRAADGYLMNGAAALATPLAAFGLPGISFDGYCLGPAGYGEIAVCAAENLASNFLALRDTGGGWTIKDGDWVAVMGNYAGGSAGTDAMILTCSS